jgi:peptide-methionine (S)-S-oxide reductase
MKEVMTIGGGCYWCLEAFFQRLKGVEAVVSGFSGGHVANPSYEEVCSETTGHAEVIQVTFDPSVISYKELLEIFFVMHDPTTLNRQGNDVGESYRSIVLYHSDEQKKIAEDIIRDFVPTIYKDPATTELKPFEVFYPGPDYHQDYYNNNPNQGYCMIVIDPKIQKLRQKFAAKLK